MTQPEQGCKSFVIYDLCVKLVVQHTPRFSRDPESCKRLRLHAFIRALSRRSQARYRNTKGLPESGSVSQVPVSVCVPWSVMLTSRGRVDQQRVSLRRGDLLSGAPV